MRRALLLSVALAATLSAVGCSDGAVKPPVSARLTVSAPMTVSGNVVTLDLSSSGIDIVKADGNTSGATGHYHVFVDRAPVGVGEPIPKERSVIHAATAKVVVPGLTIGHHTLTVVLGNGAHVRIDSPAQTVEVDVRGPALHATANVLVTGDVSVHTATEGVIPTGAHVHLYVDPASAPAPGDATEPTAMVEPNADSPLAALKPGEHTIWAVLADQDHKVVGPLVADKLTVTVPAPSSASPAPSASPTAMEHVMPYGTPSATASASPTPSYQKSPQ